MVRQALSFERFLRVRSGRRGRRAGRALPSPALDRPEAAGLEGQRFALMIGPVVSIACKTLAWSGRWDVAREAAARGWDGSLSSGLVHVASYREAALAEIDRLAGRLADSEAEARTAWDILRDLAPFSIPALVAISNLVATLIARGQLDEAGELAEQWDLSAPFSLDAARPSPARDPRHPSSGSRGAREWSRGPAGGRRGPGGDAHPQPGGDSLAPGGRARPRGARSHCRGPADRHRGRDVGRARSEPAT